MINCMEDTSDNTVKKIVKIVPVGGGERFGVELPDRSAIVGVFTDEHEAAVHARLAGYRVA